MMEEQELNKKLAEFAFDKTELVCTPNEEHPRGIIFFWKGGQHLTCELFTLSETSCFKWLAPETLELLAKKGHSPPIMKLFQLWYDELITLTGDSSNTQRAALALCLAIEKLIDSKNS